MPAGSITNRCLPHSEAGTATRRSFGLHSPPEKRCNPGQLEIIHQHHLCNSSRRDDALGKCLKTQIDVEGRQTPLEQFTLSLKASAFETAEFRIDFQIGGNTSSPEAGRSFGIDSPCLLQSDRKSP